ncbi:MAG: hypothetical protein ABSB68_01395 [Acidimicrobiales bacterium]
MILLDELPSGASSGSSPAVGSIRELVDGAWRNDVALEMWIDVTSEPIAIRLAGTLDESTGANLFDVIADCVARGGRDFHLDTSALRMDSAGWPVMERIRQRVHGAGGRVRWDRDASA